MTLFLDPMLIRAQSVRILLKSVRTDFNSARIRFSLGFSQEVISLSRTILVFSFSLLFRTVEPLYPFLTDFDGISFLGRICEVGLTIRQGRLCQVSKAYKEKEAHGGLK